MPLPNFFIIGAAKSGTTSLYYYLSQHPEIYMSTDKEPAYFYSEKEVPDFEFTGSVISKMFKGEVTNGAIYNYNEYLSLFDGAKEEKAIGEATTDYLTQPETPDFIFRCIPDAKIIALLRNPFDAAYSDFMMKQRDGVWKKGVTFLGVLKAENLAEENLRVYPNLIRIRHYDDGIDRYLKKFPINQVRVFLFEDLKNPQKLLADCFRFLEVSPDFRPDFTVKHNTASAISSSMPVYSLLRYVPQVVKDGLKKITPSSALSWYTGKRLGVSSANQSTTTKCPLEEKEFLRPILTPRILKLQELINRDLSHWLD